MYQPMQMGVQGVPSYLGSYKSDLASQNQNAGDRARLALGGSLGMGGMLDPKTGRFNTDGARRGVAEQMGMGGVTDQTGRFDGQQIGGVIKKFCV